MKQGGATGSENVGMSNHKTGKSPVRRKPKVSSAMVFSGGLGGPKCNPSPRRHKLFKIFKIIFVCMFEKFTDL